MALALKGCDGSDEDVLTYAMFPQVAPKFFSTRYEGPKNLGKDPSKAAPQAAPAAAGDAGKGPVQTTVAYEIKLNGKTTKVTVSPA
jgi:methylmalonyl-CoA carboxyltransferase 5S subunit